MKANKVLHNFILFILVLTFLFVIMGCQVSHHLERYLPDPVEQEVCGVLIKVGLHGKKIEKNMPFLNWSTKEHAPYRLKIEAFLYDRKNIDEIDSIIVHSAYIKTNKGKVYNLIDSSNEVKEYFKYDDWWNQTYSEKNKIERYYAFYYSPKELYIDFENETEVIFSCTLSIGSDMNCKNKVIETIFHPDLYKGKGGYWESMVGI